MAVGQGFEPWKPLRGLHALQACAIDRSAIPPCSPCYYGPHATPYLVLHASHLLMQFCICFIQRETLTAKAIRESDPLVVPKVAPPESTWDL